MKQLYSCENCSTVYDEKDYIHKCWFCDKDLCHNCGNIKYGLHTDGEKLQNMIMNQD